MGGRCAETGSRVDEYGDGDAARPERPEQNRVSPQGRGSKQIVHADGHRTDRETSSAYLEQHTRASEHAHEAEERSPRRRARKARAAVRRVRRRGPRASRGARRGRRRGRARRVNILVRALDNLRSLLREAVHRGHQVRGELEREHGRVRDAHVRQAVHLEVRTDDAALRLRQHRARARRVVLRVYVVLQPVLPVVVALHVRAWADLLAHVGAKRRGVAEFAAEPEALAEDCEI